MTIKVVYCVPAVLQVELLYKHTIRTLARACPDKQWCIDKGVEIHLVLPANRLKVRTFTEYKQEVMLAFPGAKTYNVIEGDHSVAHAWNIGLDHAKSLSADFLVTSANDIDMEPDCFQRLIEFGHKNVELGYPVGLWSGVSTNDEIVRDLKGTDEGCDFNCFCCDPTILCNKVGRFDENFRPAYFEDNDMAARLALVGLQHRYVYAARFYHHISLTKRLDPEMAHHIHHWFKHNFDYFVRKWGCAPVNKEIEMRGKYYSRPFNNPANWVGFWETVK